MCQRTAPQALPCCFNLMDKGLKAAMALDVIAVTEEVRRIAARVARDTKSVELFDTVVPLASGILVSALFGESRGLSTTVCHMALHRPSD